MLGYFQMWEVYNRVWLYAAMISILRISFHLAITNSGTLKRSTDPLAVKQLISITSGKGINDTTMLLLNYYNQLYRKSPDNPTVLTN